MARQTSFGDMLRMGRERKGLDLSAAARKLRIRPDILRAIEEGDFARMPPRGYTTNMVGAYARLVGLNPTELTRAYRDEAYQFETGRRPMDGRSERTRSAEGHQRDRSSSRPGSRRTEYLDGPRSSRTSQGRSSRNGRVPTQPQYTNLVQGRQAPGIAANFSSFLPLLIVGAIIVGLLVLVIVLAFGGDKGSTADDTPTVPISGMPNPSGTTTSGDGGQDAQAPAVEPVAPKNALFTYTVDDGKTAYIEVVVDGKTKEAAEVTGPKTQEYPVTGELKFVTTNPEAVKLTLDGEEVKPTEGSSGNGVYHYDVNFEDVLREWQQANGVKPSSSDSAADDADKSGSGEGTSDSSDDSGTSGSSDTSDTSDTSGSSDSNDNSGDEN